jgi:tetratricopeptide (TPR) repeat protein
LSKVTQIRQRARTFLQKGKFDKAIEEYKRLTGMETKNPNYLNELGDIYLKAGDSVQAVSNFEKAVVNYEKVALYNNAVAVCKKILRIVPDRGDTIYKLGELRAKQKLGGEAKTYFSTYLDHILANADSAGPELGGKIDGILELVPENAQILDKAGDALVMIGIKSGALEIYSKLRSDAEKTGERDQAAAYEAKMDLLKQSMTKDEIRLVEKAMESAGGTGEPERAESVVVPEPHADDGLSVAGEAQQSPSIEMGLEPETDGSAPAAAPQVIADGEPTGTDESGSETVETGSASEADEDGDHEIAETEPGTGPESEIAMEAEPSREPDDGSAGRTEMEAPVPGDAGEEMSAGPEPKASGEEPSSDVADADTEADESTGEPEAEVTSGDGTDGQHGDLSSLLDDVRNTDTAESLVEEITSDVEEDDFRSHYDLGMAYLEMALYTEAIKEFQIASRSEQIQIKSIEMIGHCFLMQNNPRLAVKQLMRGLELVKVANSESLGVHYNLGLAYEMLGDMEKAREHYEEVYIVDISFRDIADKMKKLSTVS